jgi:hypothetical protein
MASLDELACYLCMEYEGDLINLNFFSLKKNLNHPIANVCSLMLKPRFQVLIVIC